LILIVAEDEGKTEHGDQQFVLLKKSKSPKYNKRPRSPSALTAAVSPHTEAPVTPVPTLLSLKLFPEPKFGDDWVSSDNDQESDEATRRLREFTSREPTFTNLPSDGGE
jgi:hypothetical protein